MVPRHAPLVVVRVEIISRRTVPVPAHVDVETVCLGVIGLIVAYVPLAYRCGGVSRRFECLRDGHLLERQVHPVIGVFQSRALAVLDPKVTEDRYGMCDVKAARTLAREDARTRRRTQSARGVGLHEPHPVLREPVDVRRLIEGAPAVTGYVSPAEVVDKEEDDVGPLLRRSVMRR